MKKICTTMLTLGVLVSIAFCARAEGQAVKILAYAGTVKVLPKGESQTLDCGVDTALFSGDTVTTGRDSYLEIALDPENMNIVKIDEASEVIIKLTENKIELIKGEILVLLKNLRKGGEFQVRTPTAICGARGTGWKTVANNESAEIIVFEGTVFVSGIKKDGSIMPGEYLTERGFKRRIEKFENPRKKQKISKLVLRELTEEMRLSPGTEALLRRVKKADERRLFESKRMTAIDNKLERMSERFASPSSTPVMGGREDEDD